MMRMFTLFPALVLSSSASAVSLNVRAFLRTAFGAVVLVFGLAGWGAVAHSATITQTLNFSTGVSLSGTNPLAPITSPGFFSGEVQPFDSALGTLESWSQEWSISFAGSLACPALVGCSASYNTQGDGQIYMGPVGANVGMGSGTGFSAGPLGTDAVLDIFGLTQSELVANAGLTYNPALLDVIVGGSPFALSWGGSTPASINYATSGVVTSTVSVVGFAILSYEYTPIPEPSTALLLGFGLTGLAGKGRRRNRS